MPPRLLLAAAALALAAAAPCLVLAAPSLVLAAPGLVLAAPGLVLAAPGPMRAAPGLLLAAPAACPLGDAFFSQTRLETFATSVVRYSNISRSYRLLSFEETCGEDWQTHMTRSALSSLGAGGGVVVVGRAGAAVCGGVAAAARALRRPLPAPCGESRARAAALARVAAELHWRRAALVTTADESDCATALLEVQREFVALGILAKLIHFNQYINEVSLRPHVIIACELSSDLIKLQENVNGTAIIFMVLEDIQTDLDLKDRHGSIWEASPGPPLDSDSSSAHNNKIANFLSHYYNVPSSKHQSTRSIDSNVNKLKKYFVKYLNPIRQHFQQKNILTNINSKLRNFTKHKSKVRSKRSLRHENLGSIYGSMPASQLPLRNILIFSDEFRKAKPTTESLYREVFEEVLSYLEAEKSKVQTTIKTFFLYKSETFNQSLKWRRVVTMTATLERSLDLSSQWMTNVVMDLPGELELKIWSAIRISEEVEELKSLNRIETAQVAVLLVCTACLVFAALALGAAYLRRASAGRAPRRPRAVPVLAAADFQFPADERRRVGEGMETMLSWLQQLHEFGGPEPERPDLLKRPEPLGHSAPSSTCSVTKLAPDNRTRYKGDPVHMKYLPASTLELRRKTTEVLLVMQSLRHENLNPFIGCLAELRPALVFEACGRGSLEDVLMADDIRLDWTFRLSLLTDLVRGVRYLHASPVRVHARLSSRNCVVDARWVLRVTDYGLPAFAAAQALPYPPRTARDLLWTAPEILRETSSATVPGGTQAADVFSFAIIMQEVIVRGEPYCMLSLSPEEIIDKLRHPPPLIRPSVSMGAAPPEAVSVMRQCWSEQPDLRPDFNRLYDVFRHMHRGRKTNIVDSMFEMLEKYSNNLEELIKDRTEQLDMEKKKTEQLLNRMLPRSVAERLMMGLRVEPEEFEEVSIYFSDIVGFTALAARSTPVQVVDLLNDLYTTFDAAIEQYRVYKVETIGDAYMVVGGLPARCRDHAESVATMALHLLHLAGRFRVRHLPGAALRLRIGLHSGACCAGVVGLTMPRYCLFGDTVNTASRMESTGAAWRIQLSSATAERLQAAGGYRLRSRGLTQVKGKGAMHTYWLLGKDGFDKPLPTPPPLESEEILFEAEGENETDTSDPAGNDIDISTGNDKRSSIQSVERQRSDPSPTVDKFSWQCSGAVSAESSPPAAGLPRCRYLRSSMSTITGPLDTPRLSDRWASSGSRTLRRQWSLERGDALAAAAAEAPARAPEEPLALRAAPARPPPPRYRTRRHASALDVSGR